MTSCASALYYSCAHVLSHLKSHTYCKSGNFHVQKLVSKHFRMRVFIRKISSEIISNCERSWRICGGIRHHIGKYGSTSYIGMTRKKMAANRKGIGLTTLKHACNSTTNTRTKYLLVVMHKTLCSVWLTFVRRENEAVQNCPIVLKNSSSSSSSSSSYYYSYFAVTHKLHKLHS